MIALSDSSRSIVERYSYDVFGQPTIRNSGGNIIPQSQFGNRFMFTGREYDTETGLYYYRARYYKPSIGRFLQTDPIGYYYSMNLYEYCWNNPTNWLDPYGLMPTCPGGAGPPGWGSGIGIGFGGDSGGGSDTGGASCEREERSRWSDYWDEKFTWPWDIMDKAWKMDKEEFPGHEDPFSGDYRHFVAAGIACRTSGPVISAMGIRYRHIYEEDPLDAAADWRGWKESMLHPLTPLRELGKHYTVRPIDDYKITVPKPKDWYPAE